MDDNKSRNVCSISEIDDFLQIRYVKLHFSLEILENGNLPRYKASALRGGMGHMLLQMYCPFDEQCNHCPFTKECTVRRIMYPEMEMIPSFMSQAGEKNRNDNEGYIIECEDYDTVFAEGDLLKFNLLLLGKTTVYFSHFLRAYCYLGSFGLGKDCVPFRVYHVTNTNGELLYDGNSDTLYKDRYQIRTVADYVDYRISQSDTAGSNKIVFHSPLSLKYKGQWENHFDPMALMSAAERRIIILNCFEGTPKAAENCRISINDHIPVFEDEYVRRETVPRYSGTQKSKTVLTGIRGSCRISCIDRAALRMLIAGELLHIGKNTTFGFGRYTLITE